jgi:hypothetical protein
MKGGEKTGDIEYQPEHVFNSSISCVLSDREMREKRNEKAKYFLNRFLSGSPSLYRLSTNRDGTHTFTCRTYPVRTSGGAYTNRTAR